MNLYQKLMKVRVDVLNANLKKTGYNKFSKFAYYELKDFLSFATEAFQEVNLYSRFSIITATPNITETATFTIINSEKPDEIEVYTIPTAECFIGRKADGTGGADPIQNLGGKITYLRRYMYFMALDLIEDDSADPKAPTPKKKPYVKSTPKKESPYTNLTEQQAKTKAIQDGLITLAKKLDSFENIEYKDEVIKSVCGIYDVKKWEDITFNTNDEYKKLNSIINQELQIAKDLQLAGI